MSLPALPALHVVTDSAVLSRPDFASDAQAVLEAGRSGVALHLRGPTSSGRVLFDLSMALGPPARRSGAWLLVNDRADVALAADLVGVHLGERSLPVPAARAVVGEDRVLGVSLHDAAGLARASEDGADYAFVGTIFATPSHPGRVGIGPDGLGGILAGAPGLAVLAIGGITPDRVGEVVRAGARGVAVLSGVWGAPDPAAATLDYLAALDRPSTEGR